MKTRLRKKLEQEKSGSPTVDDLLRNRQPEIPHVAPVPEESETKKNDSEISSAKELEFGNDEANALLDLLGGIDALAASKIYGIPMQVTSEAFKFTAQHREKINPPVIRLLNKWSPTILKNWKDEIGAAIVIGAVLNTQVQLMHILENKRKRSQPNQVIDISRPAQPAPEKKEEPVTSAVKSDDILENVGFGG